MPQKKTKIVRLYGMQEATWATDPSATGALYKHLKVLADVAAQPGADLIERQGMVGDLVSQDGVIGAKGGTLTFKVEMKASGTPATALAIASESSDLLEAALGTVFRGTGTTVGAASGNGAVGTPLKVTATAGLRKYMMIEVAGEQRFVTSILSGTDLVLNRPLSANPVATTVVYASSMFYRANSGHKSMAFVFNRDGIEYTLLGCKVKVKLAGVAAKGTGLLDVSVDVGTWVESAKGSLPAALLTGVTAVKAPVVKGSPFALDLATEPITALEFDPGVQIEFIESTEGVDGKAGIEAVDANPTGSFSPYYASSRLSDFLAAGVKGLAFTSGDRNNGWGIIVPRAQYGSPSLEDKNGMVGHSVPFFARANGVDPDYVICQF